MKIKYRPEIDGLRAIAVVAVILYHAQITILGHKLFKGGFIGVDIFFVISGYLITSIILKELVITGTFSFKNFYERRIRRILPALLFVMLVSLPFAWIYLLPNSLIDFIKSILYSLGFSSNFYFHYSGQRYGLESGLLKPFLHTWSLSVEEQFYILFPITLFITFKYFRKYIGIVFIFVFLISLIIADWGSRNHPSFNFYVLPTRVWELIAGSILAYFEITGKEQRYRILNLILPVIGLFLIGYSILFFENTAFHPSFNTLLPIIGACLIIWFSNKEKFITKILSSKLFVGIGLISYSLYLWHYPIFALGRYADYISNNLDATFAVVFTFIFSTLSYFFIEKPFRNRKYKFSKILISLSILIILIISISVYFNFKIKTNFQNHNTFIKNNPDISRVGFIYKLSGCWYGCEFKSNNDTKIVITGDSNMHSFMYDLKPKLLNKNYNLKVFSVENHLFNIFKINKKTKKKFDNNYNKFEKELLDIKNSIIIFNVQFPLYIENRNFNNMEGGVERKLQYSFYETENEKRRMLNYVKKNIEKLSEKNKIIIVYPVPEVGWDVPRKIKNKFSRYKKNDLKNISISDYITTSYDVFLKRNNSSLVFLNSINNENIIRIYPHKLLCDKLVKSRCITHDENNVFYFDDIHLSIEGTKLVNSLIMKEIVKIVSNSN